MLIEDDVAKQWDKRGGGRNRGRERERERECVLIQREKIEMGDRRSVKREAGRGERERERAEGGEGRTSLLCGLEYRVVLT